MLLFYNKEMISRPSCYNCKFKGNQRRSDFTVGDYFYVSGCAPEMDDGDGVTALLINTEKGKESFNEIRKYLEIKKLNFSKDNILNGGMVMYSAKANSKKEEFFKELNKSTDLLAMQKKFYPKTFGIINQIKRKVIPILYKFGFLKAIKKVRRKKQYIKMGQKSNNNTV